MAHSTSGYHRGHITSSDNASRQLFVIKVMHSATGEKRWDSMYRQALGQRAALPGGRGVSFFYRLKA